MTGRRAALAVALACAAPAAARAQVAAADGEDDEIAPDRRARRAAAEANLEPARSREGIALGFSVGPVMQVAFGIGEASWAGGSVDIRIGTSATERLAWFIDLFNTTTPARLGDETFLSQNTLFTVGAQLYILDAMWLRGSVGVARLELGNTGVADDARGGLGALGGGGFDFLRRGRFTLSGTLTFGAAIYGDGVVTDALGHLAFTWY